MCSLKIRYKRLKFLDCYKNKKHNMLKTISLIAAIAAAVDTEQIAVANI